MRDLDSLVAAMDKAQYDLIIAARKLQKDRDWLMAAISDAVKMMDDGDAVKAQDLLKLALDWVRG